MCFWQRKGAGQAEEGLLSHRLSGTNHGCSWPESHGYGAQCSEALGVSHPLTTIHCPHFNSLSHSPASSGLDMQVHVLAAPGVHGSSSGSLCWFLGHFLPSWNLKFSVYFNFNFSSYYVSVWHNQWFIESLFYFNFPASIETMFSLQFFPAVNWFQSHTLLPEVCVFFLYFLTLLYMDPALMCSYLFSPLHKVEDIHGSVALSLHCFSTCCGSFWPILAEAMACQLVGPL